MVCYRPAVDDHAGDLPRPVFLAIVAEDARQFILGGGVDDVRRRSFLGGVHAHVQRRVFVIGKAALAAVELERGDAKVGEYAVKARVAHQFPRVVEIAAYGAKIGGVSGVFPQKGRDPFAGGVDGVRVAVDAGHATAPPQYFQRVSAAAQRAVEVFPAGGDAQAVHALRQEHREVVKFHTLSPFRKERAAPTR